MTFVEDLKKEDPGIGERWEKATGGKLTKTIGKKELEAIVLPVFKTGTVTPRQARALAMLFRTSLSDGAHATPTQEITNAFEKDFFFKGSARALTTVKDLELLNGALGMGSVGKINFVSPGTGLEYTPDVYSAIRSLVHQEKIKVFEVNAGRLQSRVGLYQRSDSKRLIMYMGFEPEHSKMFAVHEATHAIQDWKDLVRSKIKYIEADGFIAGAVAALSVNKNAIMEHPAETPAAELVLAGQATLRNMDWTTAYENVVKAVKADPFYKADAENNVDWNEHMDEEALLKAALVHFKVADFLAAMGGDVYKNVSRFIPGQQ
ncbi:hypothetical protein [Bradyrhizobium sp. 6(2017)]|uniref:hypothetical protein n=1 Tax=Bradyrhizobium sp. 6(2017) TaxID=1197460 RepID=UPI0013E1BF51|nr:hypothetical protein [Bradyrhizobium sp. 6(2017)]QIG93474.1 hypothetical protein G6P99_13810 [Bradyrhizobium sp. 6(2017)]